MTKQPTPRREITRAIRSGALSAGTAVGAGANSKKMQEPPEIAMDRGETAPDGRSATTSCPLPKLPLRKHNCRMKGSKALRNSKNKLAYAHFLTSRRMEEKANLTSAERSPAGGRHGR